MRTFFPFFSFRADVGAPEVEKAKRREKNSFSSLNNKTKPNLQVGPPPPGLPAQPAPLHVRPRRRPHHARARHPRAQLLPPARGRQVWRRREGAAVARGARQPFGGALCALPGRVVARLLRRGVQAPRSLAAVWLRPGARRGRLRALLHADRQRLLARAADARHQRGRARHDFQIVQRAPAEIRRLHDPRRRPGPGEAGRAAGQARRDGGCDAAGEGAGRRGVRVEAAGPLPPLPRSRSC